MSPDVTSEIPRDILFKRACNSKTQGEFNLTPLLIKPLPPWPWSVMQRLHFCVTLLTSRFNIKLCTLKTPVSWFNSQPSSHNSFLYLWSRIMYSVNNSLLFKCKCFLLFFPYLFFKTLDIHRNLNFLIRYLNAYLESSKISVM